MLHEKQQTSPTAYLVAGVPVVFGVLAALYQNELMAYLALAGLIGLVLYGAKVHYSDEFSRTVVLMILIVSTVFFWALFEQTAGSMTLYADRAMDRTLLGVEWTASQYGSLNALFIMTLAIPFAVLWTWLSRHKLEPSTPAKFGIGILFAGLGFGALVLGANSPDSAGRVAAIWMVLAYLLHTIGELSLSPVGLSAVTKLSIGRVVGVSMGTWFLATALAETVATRMGKLAAIDTSGGKVGDAATAVATYTELFQFLMYVGVGVGILMIVISPILAKFQRGIH